MQASFLTPCQINILIVEDGFLLSFLESEDFSLSLFITHLRQRNNPYVIFNVDTAHRDNDAVGANHSNYKFDNLHEYDEVWLFGEDIFRPTNPLPDDELYKIIHFMVDEQKGVFATGDHEDLGAKLNSRIPRVRSMRKWYKAGANPMNYPEAPPRDSAERRDTLRKGSSNIYKSENQSDDTPQEIESTLHSTPSSMIYGTKYYPHPLLCGTRGTITVLPDHMHEGECYVPNPEDFQDDEYPILANRIRPIPQIIAWSSIPESHTTQGDQRDRHRIFDPVQPARFGAICAYDGHIVNIGRVVVQSSFHHFINLNLTGFESSHTEEGNRAYEDIKNYYCNLAIWLAPPEKQWAIFQHILWLALKEPSVVSQLQKNLVEGTISSFAAIHNLGTVARQALKRLTSPCFALEWAVTLIEALFKEKGLPYFLNPWLEIDPLLSSPATLKQINWIDTEFLVDVVIGSSILEIATNFSARNPEAFENAENPFQSTIWQGLLTGIKLYADSLVDSGIFLHTFAEASNFNKKENIMNDFCGNWSLHIPDRPGNRIGILRIENVEPNPWVTFLPDDSSYPPSQSRARIEVKPDGKWIFFSIQYGDDHSFAGKLILSQNPCTGAGKMQGKYSVHTIQPDASLRAEALDDDDWTGYRPPAT